MSDLDHATRLSRLEERLAWFERHVVDQDKVMLELSAELRTLRDALETLRTSTDPQRNFSESQDGEKPPHY